MSMAKAAGPAMGHNGGPPLDADPPHVPEWEDGDPCLYFQWKAARRQAWKGKPAEILMLRSARAEAAGVSDEVYTLELLERGRHLQPGDDPEYLRNRWKTRLR